MSMKEVAASDSSMMELAKQHFGQEEDPLRFGMLYIDGFTSNANENG